MSGKELTRGDLEKVARKLKWCVPALSEAVVIGSGAVAATHSDLPAHLRFSVDFDFVPRGLPVLYSDSQLVERFLGPESDFCQEELVYADYVTADTLRCTPSGWEERAEKMWLPEGLTLYCLDPHDVAYNKLHAGRAKDLVWVRDLLKAGLINFEHLQRAHSSNPLTAEDRARVDRSFASLGVPDIH